MPLILYGDKSIFPKRRYRRFVVDAQPDRLLEFTGFDICFSLTRTRKGKNRDQRNDYDQNADQYACVGFFQMLPPSRAVYVNPARIFPAEL